MRRNEQIIGRGTVVGGEYDLVSIAGTAKTAGEVRCMNLRNAGVFRTDADFICEELFSSGGKCDVEGSLTVGSLKAAGTTSVRGDLTAEHDVSLSGTAQISGNLKGRELRSSGSLEVCGGIEGETAEITGQLTCRGLLNAETVDIRYVHGGLIGSVGGGKISIRPDTVKDNVLAKFGEFVVMNSIEGDEIFLEYVTANTVTGTNVTIGRCCSIDTVNCSGKLEIAPNSVVKNIVNG